MKFLTPGLLALALCFITESDAFGQVQQSCNCNQGNSQSTQWSSCQSCNDHGCSRLASLWTRPLFPRSCAAKCCATKAYPDAGWNPPAHRPVNYDGAWYGSYLPQNAYGTPGGGFIANYPTVYQPTDTTQMGYYYNKVPTWQSRSDMIPPTPYPSNFHARVCPQGGPGCRNYHGTFNAPAASSCQSCNNVHYSAAPHFTSPNGHQVVRSAGPQRQGLLGGFRLTSMTEIFD